MMHAPESRRPVIALMGEFSAGKSTLANLLIGERVSPERVTATQLPPVWYAKGEGRPVVVGLDGREREIARADIAGVDAAETACIRVPLAAGALELMDIVDLPGISDPNMPTRAWMRLARAADAVIWCSHATQAWRQSEAATWAEMPAALHAHSLLLLTRMDKLHREADRRRVLSRVRAETEGLFEAVLPISLLQAAEAGNDVGAWEESGADAFTERLLDLVTRLARDRAEARPVARDRASVDAVPPGEPARPDRVADRVGAGASPGTETPVRTVVPRRVAPQGHRAPRRPRLPASALDTAPGRAVQ
jgi:hypothetical protein